MSKQQGILAASILTGMVLFTILAFGFGNQAIAQTANPTNMTSETFSTGGGVGQPLPSNQTFEAQPNPVVQPPVFVQPSNPQGGERDEHEEWEGDDD